MDGPVIVRVHFQQTYSQLGSTRMCFACLANLKREEILRHKYALNGESCRCAHDISVRLKSTCTFCLACPANAFVWPFVTAARLIDLHAQHERAEFSVLACI